MGTGMATFTGTSGNDNQDGTSGGDRFRYSQGGNDKLNGLGGGDEFFQLQPSAADAQDASPIASSTATQNSAPGITQTDVGVGRPDAWFLLHLGGERSRILRE